MNVKQHLNYRSTVSSTKSPGQIKSRFFERAGGLDLFRWSAAVSDFTSRKLTYESDKLPALFGLARLNGQDSKGGYVAGLWRSDLLELLLWRVESNDSKRYVKYHAPSWSWASVTGKVAFDTGTSYLSNNFPIECKVLDICQTLGSELWIHQDRESSRNAF
jgi:hypothetical protein